MEFLFDFDVVIFNIQWSPEKKYQENFKTLAVSQGLNGCIVWILLLFSTQYLNKVKTFKIKDQQIFCSYLKQNGAWLCLDCPAQFFQKKM